MTDRGPASAGRGDRAPLWTPTMVRVVTTLFLGAMVPNVFVLASRFLGAHHYDKRDIGVVMGAFNLTALLASPLVGWATARFGHARVLATGCLVAAGGALVFEMSHELVGYAAGRSLQGLGFAAVLIGAAAYVAESAPAGRLGEALGVSGVLTLAAQAVGPAVAERIEAWAGWDWVWRTGALAAAAGALVALNLPAVARRDTTGDGPRVRSASTLAATVLAGVGFGTVWTFLADYGGRVGIEHVTPFFAAYVVAAISTRLTMGTLSDRIGRRQAAAPALLGHGAVLVLLSRLDATWHLVVAGLGYGLCHGVYYPTLQAQLVERSGGQRSRAIASSTFAFGAGIVVAAFGLGPVARATDYPVIYLIAAGGGVAAAAVVWWAPPRS